MALAITSFPVPVSPWIKTAESTGATMFIWLSTAWNFGLDPIKSKVVIALFLYGCENGSQFASASHPQLTMVLLQWADKLPPSMQSSDLVYFMLQPGAWSEPV